MSNEFVADLKDEKMMTAELGYQLKTSWLGLNFNAFYSHLDDVTDQSMYYSDSDHSFSYVSLTGIAKSYYGLELGANVKVTDWLNIKALGTISEAKYMNNANVNYMLSEDGVTHSDVVLNKGMREGNTPLTAASLDLSYHANGCYVDLIGNYYDDIYLYYSPVTRYSDDVQKAISAGNDPDLSLECIQEKCPCGEIQCTQGQYCVEPGRCIGSR